MQTLVENVKSGDHAPPHGQAQDPTSPVPPGLIPLSFAQQRLWFLDQLEPNLGLYNVPMAIRLKGVPNLPALGAALNEIVARHEALRTNISAINGTPAQRIRPPFGLQIRVIEAGNGTGPGTSLAELLSQEAARPFDLANEPLIRATLFRQGYEDHVLLFCLHHIICDEWSLRVLCRELSVLYGAFCRREPPPLPELAIQYADFAVWQREALQGTRLAKQLTYWKQRLSGAVPRLELPTDFPRPAVRSHAGRQVFLDLPKELAHQMRDLSRREGVTLFMALLASLQALLARYTGQEDVVLGAPSAGRTRVETEELVGFFVNTLVLRTDLSADPTFREVLRRTKETTLGAYDNQDLPFEKLVEELHPNRSASDMPLIQAMFAFEQSLEQDLRMPNLGTEFIDVELPFAKFDLTWAVREQPGSLQVCVEFSTELFEEGTIQRMLSHWRNLLEAVANDPTQRLSRIPLLGSDERRQLLVEWNQTDRSYPHQTTLAALFEAQVQRRPAALAVRYGSSELTYLELNQRANRLAHALRSLGIKPEKPVALCTDRSIELIVGMLGIIKAGGAYVPLDPTYPRERLQLILDDTRASVVVTQSHLQSALPASHAQVLSLDSLPETAVENLSIDISPEHLAYIIYTSGSSGVPKGVLVTHQSILRLLCNTDYISLTHADKIAQASHPCFDAATFEIWGALLHGAALIGIERDVMLLPEEFAAQLAREEITTLFLTTALFNQVADHSPTAFRALKHLLFGGEAVDPTRVARVIQMGKPERLLHVYGPTETTTFATWYSVAQVPSTARTVPIGRPIANTTAYLLDRTGQPVPIGVAGELHIGGPGVARGYLNQPALTAEKFIPDPFSPRPEARLYKTGDLARYRADGNIEFIGRVDHQVKIRGFRVELGEIEAVLATHPSVREVMVLACNDESSLGKRLVAYLALREEAAKGAVQEVREFLKVKLPAYMIPAQFISLPSLPLNANGKVDRTKLPAPEQSRMEVGHEFTPPRDALENKLAGLWKQVLGLERIGVQDNFFELGGHSLLAVKLFTGIEQQFRQKLPLASLFQRPTVAQLAELIRLNDPKDPWPLIVDIQPEGSKTPIFWIHSLGGDGGGAFFYYRKLAQLLGSSQPSYGIRSPQTPFTNLPEMASRYVDELVQFKPEGPYLLGGFCFGGIVAFEMASELYRRGLEVGLLALLESVPPGARPKLRWEPAVAAALLSNVRSWMADAFSHPAELTTRLQRKRKSLQKRFQQRFGDRGTDAQAAGLGDLIDMAEYPKDYVKYAEAHWQALLGYQPKTYPGRIQLFRARKQPLLSIDPTLGWGGLAGGGIEVNVIPGTHEKMLEEPNVQLVAAALKTCLRTALTRNDERLTTGNEVQKGSGA